MRGPRRPAQELRLAIECLPYHTKVAMLEGVRSSDIIVGAYTDRSGGVCPMLAAHRRGGRTDFVSFAHAWDRYTGARSRPRKATERELRTLTTMLEASTASDEGREDLAAVVAAHVEVKRRRAAEAERTPPDTGERDRAPELRHRPGWAWLRLFRRYDEYEAALERMRDGEREPAEYEAERV